MVESPFSKVTGEISTFCKLCHVVGLFRNVAHQQISSTKVPLNGICRLTVYKLQCALKLTPNQISYRSFEKYPKFRQISWMMTVMECLFSK